MKKFIMLTAVLTVVFATVAPDASLAQTTGASGSAGASAQSVAGTPSPNPQDYVLEKDGTVVIGGDVATNCPSFALSLKQGYTLAGNPKQARSVLEQCERAGFLSPDGQLATTEAQPSSDTGGTLPDTGGLDLLPPVWVGVALCLAGLGVLKLAGRCS